MHLQTFDTKEDLVNYLQENGMRKDVVEKFVGENKNWFDLYNRGIEKGYKMKLYIEKKDNKFIWWNLRNTFNLKVLFPEDISYKEKRKLEQPGLDNKTLDKLLEKEQK